MRVAFSLLAAVAALQRADAQLSASAQQCEAQLVSISSTMNSACCAVASNCDSGAPTECSSACATVFMPFYQQVPRLLARLAPLAGARASRQLSQRHGREQTPGLAAAARAATRPA
jgi:hypothetical protein